MWHKPSVMIDLPAIDAEIAQTRRKLLALEALAAVYRGEPSTASQVLRARPAREHVKVPASAMLQSYDRTGRPRKNAETVAEAERLIRANNGVPMPTVDLLKLLEDADFKINGDNPQNNLSAMLSNSGLFQANGREGWTLKRPSSEIVSASAGGSRLDPEPPADVVPAGTPADADDMFDVSGAGGGG